MSIIDKINAEQLKSSTPDFGPGDTIRVHQLIQEGSKERIQVFEGVVICRDGGGINESFRVRKVSHGVGVERVFPIHSPKISKVEVKQRGKVRRARLYYLRELSGKAAKIKESLAHYNKKGETKKAASKGKEENKPVAPTTSEPKASATSSAPPAA